MKRMKLATTTLKHTSTRQEVRCRVGTEAAASFLCASVVKVATDGQLTGEQNCLGRVIMQDLVPRQPAVERVCVCVCTSLSDVSMSVSWAAFPL